MAANQERLYVMRSDDMARLRAIGGKCWLSADSVAAAILHWALETIETHDAEFVFMPMPREKK